MGYCDGWSEKQFDHGQAVVKCSNWISKNPPSLAGNDVGDEITGMSESLGLLLRQMWGPCADRHSLENQIPLAGSHNKYVKATRGCISRVFQVTHVPTLLANPGDFPSVPKCDGLPADDNEDELGPATPATPATPNSFADAWSSLPASAITPEEERKSVMRCADRTRENSRAAPEFVAAGASQPLFSQNTRSAHVSANSAGDKIASGGAGTESQLNDEAAMLEIDALLAQTTAAITSRYSGLQSDFRQQVPVRCKMRSK